MHVDGAADSMACGEETEIPAVALGSETSDQTHNQQLLSV